MANPQDRTSGLDEAELRGPGGCAELDQIAQATADALAVPIALVSVLDDDHEIWKGAHGLPPALADRRVAAAISSTTREVLTTGKPMLLQDARRRHRVDHAELAIVAYAGVPVVTAEGECVAVLAAIDHRPRAWHDRDVRVLRGLAHAAAAVAEQRRLTRQCDALRAELARRKLATDLLLGIAAAATTQPSADALEDTPATLGRHVGWPCVELLTLEDEELRSVGWYAADDRYHPLRQAPRRRLGDDGLAIAALRSRLPVTDHDLDRLGNTAHGRRAAELGLRTAFATPVLLQHAPIGVLELFTPEPRPVMTDLLDLLPRAALLIGQLMDRRLAARAHDRRTAELETIAMHDDLTGLLNRRGYYALAESALAIARRRREPATVLFLDVDGLKRINDRDGHAAGDELLRQVAAVLRAAFESEVIARIGGDEFVVFSNEADADALTARLDVALAAANAARGAGPPLAWSLGTATFNPEQPRSLDGLMTDADARMYAVKARHRRAEARR
ncbi:MAG: GGDEF domain-containing protein [Myxococcales bacterium]|nr:GGDEF domain-containing protein [Myxococcales bacterium]